MYTENILPNQGIVKADQICVKYASASFPKDGLRGKGYRVSDSEKKELSFPAVRKVLFCCGVLWCISDTK
jgi:hypothetical protein